jgi:ribosome-binding factor A
MPDLVFYNDDSLEYINNLENAVKGKENPIKDTDLLDKRKNL